ncbi:hypothetical protein BN126_1633 [Cronobacter sakazakii 680]|nr:hypothetical protein BN126_1633 [Cronobacter sakazakii 680]
MFSPHTLSQFPDALLLNDGIDQSGKETGADGGAFGVLLPDQTG